MKTYYSLIKNVLPLKITFWLALFTLTATASFLTNAADIPDEFGTDWDDPRTAAPPVKRPDGFSCSVKIVDTEFTNFTPYTSTYTPPEDCPGPWQAVVLEMHGSIAGRQFDRLGYLNIGDVTVFKTSTPEPSLEGIEWNVEKDLTEYAALFKEAQPIEMLIANVVNDTYTGILDIEVSLTFYPGSAPEGTATDIIGLNAPHKEGTALVGGLSIAANTERLFADVYATGSGGGCEEFWYLTTPDEAAYSCPGGKGPYREVQIRIDGTLAGIAAPYPHVYTGGWANPFLWSVLPAPRAFNIQPIRYDLTPFIGLLTDDQEHEVQVNVFGVPENQSGWDVPVTFLAWRDHNSTRVSGGLINLEETTLVNEVDYLASDEQDDSSAPPFQLHTFGEHSLLVTGYIETSRGRITTTVNRRVQATTMHLWNGGETDETVIAEWRDNSKTMVESYNKDRSTSSHTETIKRKYTMDGHFTLDENNVITTTIKLGDHAITRNEKYPHMPQRHKNFTRINNTYEGSASWRFGVPREERHATGLSTEQYCVSGSTHYQKSLTAKNGFIIEEAGN